ncbi:alpha/beta fold hydrolase [Nonomuraea sp. CA-141351]|uniref:alpha/beta fold hydrolase n=1 Tax=Nonomuraea sp. CA-141351 TaxID=3239996 RepID=UPI003D8F37AB
MRGPVLSRTSTFHFEAVRALWSSPFNGADYGEVVSAVSRVRPGDFESWHRQWTRLAMTAYARGEQLSDRVSRGKALLRASNYMRTAEFYLEPGDPRRMNCASRSRTWFDAGLAALGVDATRSRTPYEGAEMETIFLRSPHPGARDVLVVHGGFDSTPEELYFVIGAGALERGFHVLLYEGPGQGNLLREFGMPFTPQWERPAATAIDSLGRHCGPGAIIGVGVSFGGHLLARAAAMEKRYDAIVLLDYFPGMLRAFAHKMPRLLRGRIGAMPAWLQLLIRLNARYDAELRWALGNALWTFGVTTLPELIAEIGRYDDGQWADTIEADVLILLGEDEHFFDNRLAHDFARRLTSARSVQVHEFPGAEGGGLHCQNGAVHLAHEVIFDWASTIKGAGR